MITWLNTSFEMRFRVIDGLTVRYAQSENRGEHALLLSPWPESLLAFEPVWSRLDTHAHLVAIDLPGFGHSQRHDALLSPRAMAEFVIHAADAFALDQPHLVGPGTGTAAALFAAAFYPDRLRSLVVGSGAAAVPLALGGLLKDWAEAEDADEFRHADPQQLVVSALAGIDARPDLELVGLWVSSPDKVGRDAGDLAGLGRTRRPSAVAFGHDFSARIGARDAGGADLSCVCNLAGPSLPAIT